MSILNSRIIKIIVPKFIRKKIVSAVIRSAVLNYYSKSTESQSAEIREVLEYLRKHPITVFPYDFQDEYIEDDIEVYRDENTKLSFVLLGDKRLYFKKGWSKRRIRKVFNGLRKEQDPRCPHCYVNETFNVEQGDVVVDIGAAEGNFALSVVDKASRIILFETNKDWIEALQATFEPWKDKVTIINKFVGDINNSSSITLDDFFSSGEKISFLKIDVEGAESRLLNGCKRILQELHSLKVAICTYHKPLDEQEFNEDLLHYGFETSLSHGYMLLFMAKNIGAPYLRRGLIRAVKL